MVPVQRQSFPLLIRHRTVLRSRGSCLLRSREYLRPVCGRSVGRSVRRISITVHYVFLLVIAVSLSHSQSFLAFSVCAVLLSQLVGQAGPLCFSVLGATSSVLPGHCDTRYRNYCSVARMPTPVSGRVTWCIFASLHRQYGGDARNYSSGRAVTVHQSCAKNVECRQLSRRNDIV